MLSEEDLRRQMHSALDPLLAPVQPRDLLAPIRQRQRRRTQLYAGVASVVAVLAITTPLVVQGLDDRRPLVAASPVTQPAVSSTPAALPSVTTSPATPGLLISAGECAGLAVTLTRPNELSILDFALEPSPAVNTATMNTYDQRYLESAGPCTDRLRVRTVGDLVHLAVPGMDSGIDQDGTPLNAPSSEIGGTQTVEIFLDCKDKQCPAGVSQPLAILDIEVRSVPRAPVD